MQYKDSFDSISFSNLFIVLKNLFPSLSRIRGKSIYFIIKEKKCIKEMKNPSMIPNLSENKLKASNWISFYGKE
jgi:hypothetical protein